MKHDEIHVGVVSGKYDKYLAADSEYKRVKSFLMNREIFPYPMGTRELSDQAKEKIEVYALLVKQALLEFLEID